jgi:hypothetical protein
MKPFPRSAALAGILGTAFVLSGCPRADSAGDPVATSKPAIAQPVPQPHAPQPPPAAPDPHNRVEVRVRTLSDPQDGWLRIEALHRDAPGAWATGEFIRDRNKVIIETENVDEFSIALPQLRIDWEHRVILRIDGHSSELTPKRRAILRLRRSPAGSWDVVEP